MTKQAGSGPTMTEEPIARLTHWFRQRPNSIEFWELVVTEDRLLWCFVGESYRSLLLRADMGERDRAEIAELPPADIATYDSQNFDVSLENLRKIRLVTGSWLRRARLIIGWEPEDGTQYEEWTLYQSRTSDPQQELVAEMETDSRLKQADVTVENS